MCNFLNLSFALTIPFLLFGLIKGYKLGQKQWNYFNSNYIYLPQNILTNNKYSSQNFIIFVNSIASYNKYS